MKKILFTICTLVLSLNLYSQTELDYLVLEKINEYRDELGLGNLEFCTQTYLSAEHHTNYMIDVGELGHREDSETPKAYHRLLKYGIDDFTLVGENCTTINLNGQSISEMSETIFNNWKTSPSHNKIMTNPEFTKAAVSCNEGTLKQYDGYPFMFSTLVLWN